MFHRVRFLTSIVAKVPIGASGMLRDPSPYAVCEYIWRRAPHLEALWFAVIPVVQALTVNVRNEALVTSYGRGWWRWRYWGTRRDTDGHTQAALMDTLFFCSLEEAGYKTKLGEVVGRLYEKHPVSTESSQTLRCDSDSLSEERFF